MIFNPYQSETGVHSWLFLFTLKPELNKIKTSHMGDKRDCSELFERINNKMIKYAN